MIEIEDSEAIELYNKLKQFILNSKEYEYSEQNGKEEGKVTFINKKGDEITVKIKCYQLDYKKNYEAYILAPNRYAGRYCSVWELKQDSREVEYGYGWDYDEYYVVTSREIPEDILKPFRKKKHRPKKPTHKVYVEYSIVDDRSIIDVLTEAYKRYCLATTTKESTLLEKDKKIKEAIKKVIEEVTQEITSSYKDIIDKCDSEIKTTKTEVEQYDSLITKYSTFDKDLIGEAIAHVLSVLTCREYKYSKVHSTYPITCYDPFDDPYFSDTTEFVNIVVDSSKYLKHYYNDEPDKSAIDKLVKSGDAIHLININDPYPMYFRKPEKSIAFLTSKNGEISFNVELDSFEYIKDFIMELVQYRFQRNLDKITQEDINICIEEFIKKSRKIEIQNRILVLKKELDTLNSKLDS